ncbi:MAG: Crp/Fnr family transcriptional regulator, partial [Bacteroidota bacterium]
MKIRTFLSSLNQLTEQEIDMALAYFYREEIKKGDFYLYEGGYANKISFVDSGLFKLFYRLKGEEKIMLFFAENQFMTDFFGYLTNSKSLRPIQALEDSVLYSINREDLDQLYDKSKNWERLGRRLAESAYVISVLRANRIIHDNYDTRVATFMAEHPDLMQRIPQYQIASYLDMTPETLSRVKKRIMKNKNP